jgi:putative transposase
MQDATDFEAPAQVDVRSDVLALFRGAIRMTLESVLEEEIREMVGAARWARLGRKDHRNGT